MEEEEEKGNGGEEEEKLMEGVAILDFDMLCATVALQTQGIAVEKRGKEEDDDDGGEFGGVQRMWEGAILDCLEDRRIAIEAACCPCYRFGKNMGRASLGSCFIQGSIYLTLVVLILFNFIAFCITKRHCFLYVGVASTLTFGGYLGYFRTRLRKQFNIKRRDSSLDDCFYHLLCPCCALCQESRTLEMNNVQDGIWHGRGDTICIGSLGEGTKELSALPKPSSVTTRYPEVCSMERASNGSDSDQSWNGDVSHSKPLASSAQPEEQN